MLYYKTPNDRALLKIEILQEEREYILAAIASSPHNYFTNAWMSLALRYLSARIEELTETLDIDHEYVPLKLAINSQMTTHSCLRLTFR